MKTFICKSKEVMFVQIGGVDIQLVGDREYELPESELSVLNLIRTKNLIEKPSDQVQIKPEWIQESKPEEIKNEKEIKNIK